MSTPNSFVSRALWLRHSACIQKVYCGNKKNLYFQNFTDVIETKRDAVGTPTEPFTIGADTIEFEI